MIECLISLLIAAIVLLIVLLVVEWALGQFLPLGGQITTLIRALFGLLLILYFVDCVVGYGGMGIFPGHWRR